MNRKLHNSLMAMMASSTLFLVGLLVVGPGPTSLDPASSMTAVAALDADAADIQAGVAQDEVADTAAPPHRGIRARQQSVRMPFFSFVPRG